MQLRVALLVLLVCPLVARAQAPADSFDFYSRGPYRTAVPRPDAITGYPAGAHQTVYAVLQRYLDTLVATAADRVRLERWGETPERRPIRALIVSDAANLARLEQIRADIASLADPRTTSPARAAEIAARAPIIVAFHYSVHGNEPAGFEAAMQVAYHMLASEEPATLDVLKNVVLVLNPSANPDGHERFAAWYNSVGVGADHPAALEQREPWGITGRFNHYRFNMNRDLVAQSQPEVRAMMDALLRWHPQVFVDHHSTTQNYFFPPVAQAVNQNLPPQATKWFDTFGRGNAAAFDKHGWQYYVRGVFDFFYVGYWDEWMTFQGATGMTYETDGGYPLNRRRDDGTISTLRDGIAHHYTASLATLETAAANRRARLLDYYDFRRSAMDEARTDRMKRVVLVPDGDVAMLAHVAGLLGRHGIEVTRLRQPATSAAAHPYLGGPATRRTFPAGSYVVDLDQPQRRLAKALLEPNAAFDREFGEQELARFQRNRRRGEHADREEYDFYDVTAWSLPLTFNLEGYWTEDAGPLAVEPVTDTSPAARVPPAPGRAGSAYVFANDNQPAARLAAQLLTEGFRVSIALQPLRADGRSYARGTFVVRTARNPVALHDRIAALAPAFGVAVTAVQSAYPDSAAVGIGSDEVVALHAPKIVVAAGDGVDQESYGAVWHYLANELHLSFTPIPLANLGTVDDLHDYNVLLIPNGASARMKRQLGDDGVTKLKAWVKDGGALVGFGGAGQLLADKDVALSTIAVVGADSAAKPDSTAPGKEPPTLSPTAAARDKPEWIPGSIFRATLDRTHWLTLGYESDRLPVYVEGATFWKLSKGGANPVAFVGDSLTLSGFIWPGNTERLLKGTAWAVVENHGSGRVVLFLTDPLFRGFWRGPARLVTNALLAAPSR
jgi:zinc carboxypeptidase